MSTTPNYPARQTDLAQVYASARRLIEYACALDVIVTIDLVSQRPRAMGNYAAAIKVWARKESEVVRSLGVPQGAPLEAWGFPIVPDRSLSGTEMRALCADSMPRPIQVMDGGMVRVIRENVWTVVGPDGSFFNAETPLKAAILANRHRVQVDPAAAKQFSDAIEQIRQEGEDERVRCMATYGTLDCPHCGGSGHIADTERAESPPSASAPHLCGTDHAHSPERGAS